MKKFAIVLAALLCAVSARAFITDTLVVKSKYVDSPSKATVIIPDDATEGHRFPTVYVLHGYDGDYRSWTTLTDPQLGRLADQYGMILVMPDGRDSWYWDSPADPSLQMESFITKELVPYVDANLPTIPLPEQRAITGLSMGGHGALYLATRHPDIWKNAGSMSGGVDIRPFPKSWKMASRLGKSYADAPDLWTAHTVAGMVPQIKEAGINITFDCGSKDFFADVNEQLHQALLKADVPHDYTSRPGKHSHAYWRNSIMYHLLFFNEKFNKK